MSRWRQLLGINFKYVIAAITLLLKKKKAIAIYIFFVSTFVSSGVGDACCYSAHLEAMGWTVSKLIDDICPGEKIFLSKFSDSAHFQLQLVINYPVTRKLPAAVRGLVPLLLSVKTLDIVFDILCFNGQVRI